MAKKLYQFLSFLISLRLAATCFAIKGSKQPTVPDKICSPNERLDRCANALCGYEWCHQIANPLMCPQVLNCIPGCLCSGGYLRADNGTCIPARDCKPLPCPTSEFYSRSRTECPSSKCQSQEPCTLSLPANPGCICHEGSTELSFLGTCENLICNCPRLSNDTWCTNSLHFRDY